MAPLPDPSTIPTHRPPAAQKDTTGPGTRFILRPICDCLALPPRSWLVEGLIPEEAMVVMFGKPGSAKSLLAVALACSVATGSPWMGRQTSKGLAIYVAGEGRSGLPYRVAAWEQKNSTKAPFALELMPGDFNFFRTGDTADLIATIKTVSQVNKLPAKSIVFDTLSNAIPGQDENLQSVISHTAAGCDRIISETGATVIFIHHPSKSNPNELRGNTVLEARADTVLQVKKNGVNGSMIVKKQRDGEDTRRYAFQLRQVQLATNLETSCVAEFVAEAAPSEETASQFKRKHPNQVGLLAMLQDTVTPADRDRQKSNGDTHFSVPLTEARTAACEQLYSHAPSDEARRKHWERELKKLEGVVLRDGDTLRVPFRMSDAGDEDSRRLIQFWPSPGHPDGLDTPL